MRLFPRFSSGFRSQVSGFLPVIAPILVFIAATPSASARVGENENELVARYGPVVSRQPARKSTAGKMSIYGERLVFKSADWDVSAVIIGGKAEEISYTKEGKWTEVQFSFLLQLNGGLKQWDESPTRNPDNHREWIRRDKATAHWSVFGGCVIRTPAAERALAADH
jgi:hypothetical protein